MTLNSASLIVLFFVIFSFMLGVIVKNIEQINSCREKRRERQKTVIENNVGQVVSVPVDTAVPKQVVAPVQVSIPQQPVVVPAPVEVVAESAPEVVEEKQEDNYDVPVIIRSIALSR